MKRTIMIIVVAVSILGASLAFAGYQTGQIVNINTTFNWALGSMGTVYNSADSIQYIGCNIQSYSGSNAYTACYARDQWDTTVSCLSTESELVKVATSLNSESYVRFTWDADGNCTFLQTSTNSYWTPKN